MKNSNKSEFGIDKCLKCIIYVFIIFVLTINTQSMIYQIDNTFTSSCVNGENLSAPLIIQWK